MKRGKLIARDYAKESDCLPDRKDDDQRDDPRRHSGFVPACVPDSMEDFGTEWPESQLDTPRVAKSPSRTN